MNHNFAEIDFKSLRTYVIENHDAQEALHVYLKRALAKPGTIYPAPQSIDDLKDFPLPKNDSPRS
ncbi:MAG: hypothetical protein VKL41_08720 [Snowella sp.]|nr:hypothetical protein [Snowella sp.]